MLFTGCIKCVLGLMLGSTLTICAIAQVDDDDREAKIVELSVYEVLGTRLEIDDLTDASENVLSMGDTDRMEDVLRQIPGLHTTSGGGLAGYGEILLRGAEPNFLKAYLDGLTISDITNSRGGGLSYHRYNPVLLERVSVSKGAQSAFYGSDAIAGVLAFEFKSPNASDSMMELSLQAGDADYRNASLGLNYPSTNGGWRAGVSHRHEGVTMGSNANYKDVSRIRLLT